MPKISKVMKKDGKVTFDGPEVKKRERFAPPTQKHKAKKGKGSYDRKPPEEDAEYKEGETSEIKKAHLDALRKKNKKNKKDLPLPKETKLRKLKPSDFEELGESASIIKFLEAIMTEDHAKAHKYLKDTINHKIQERISKEIEKPLF